MRRGSKSAALPIAGKPTDRRQGTGSIELLVTSAAVVGGFILLVAGHAGAHVGFHLFL